MRELEAKLLRLGVVSLNLRARGAREYTAVARSRGGRTVVVRGVTPDLAVGMVLAVLSVAPS